MAKSELAIHCIISGKVQGVWFRASTKQKALALTLNGWVRNLPTGEVEVFACGDKAATAALHAWLQKGPPKAEVIKVEYEEVAWEEHDTFKVI